MWSLRRTQPTYSTLVDKDPEHGYKQDTKSAASRFGTATNIRSLLLVLLMAIVGVSSAIISLTFVGILPYPAAHARECSVVQAVISPHDHKCTVPTVRQEWRTLSEDQKLDFITAVQCLAVLPSVLHPNTSLYDDFPWVHKELSHQTHRSASFLPWHREFIHLYEHTLKEECGMQGNLPYWDWSLDWVDPGASPIWNGQSGFGGNGDANGAETIGNGRCITDGPFANFSPSYFDGQYQPHCLSRGFPPESELKTLGELIQPFAIEAMMQEQRYSTFEETLEKRAHHFLSHSVRGDLSRFTGPNDPVFFLHHANIDRLWWRWQRAGPQSKLYEYNSQFANAGNEDVSLADLMNMGGLGTDITVVDVMQTESPRLCYTY